MAVPHYTYLKMKMPGNTGIPLTIHGSFLRSDNCDKEFNRIAQGFGMKDEHRAYAALVDHTQPPEDGRTPAPDEFNPTDQTSKKQVHPKDVDKTVNVAKNLTDK